MPSFRRFALFSVLATLTLSFAVAAPRRVEPSKRAENIQTKRADVEIIGFERNEAIQNQRFTAQQFDMQKQSSFDGKMARLDRIGPFSTSQRQDFEVKSFDTWTKEMARFDGKQANLRDLDTVQTFGMARITEDPIIVRMPDSAKQIADAVPQVSLRDLNAYVFPRNYSDEPGIPAEAAGASPEEAGAPVQ